MGRAMVNPREKFDDGVCFGVESIRANSTANAVDGVGGVAVVLSPGKHDVASGRVPQIRLSGTLTPDRDIIVV